MTKKITSLIFLLVFITSCKPLYQVSGKENSGIPFFDQQVVATATKTYEENFAQIEVKRTFKGKKASQVNKDVDLLKVKNEQNDYTTTTILYTSVKCGYELNNVISVISDPNEAASEFNDMTSKKSGSCKYYNEPYKIIKVAELACQQKNGRLSLISDDIQRKVTINPVKKYINVRRSITGSTEATITLSENGTLSAATVKTQDDLIGKIIDKVPLGEIITSFIETDSVDNVLEMVDTTNKEVINLTFKLIPEKRHYKLTKNTILENAETPILKPSPTTYDSFTVIKVTANQSDIADKDKDDQTIKLNGSIVLPEKKGE